MSTSCVFFAITALTVTPCGFMKGTGVDLRTGTLCLFYSIVGMHSPVNAVPRSTSIAKYSTTDNSAHVRKLTIMKCNVTLPFIFNLSFEAKKGTAAISYRFLKTKR